MNSAPNSSGSKTGRISISDSPGIGFGQRLTHSTASSIDFTCHSQSQATSSLVSANGPSITVRPSPAKRTRLPRELGCSPSTSRKNIRGVESSRFAGRARRHRDVAIDQVRAGGRP
nr:hypothetical protein [Burkholderia pseudomultivorans]